MMMMIDNNNNRTPFTTPQLATNNIVNNINYNNTCNTNNNNNNIERSSFSREEEEVKSLGRQMLNKIKKSLLRNPLSNSNGSRMNNTRNNKNNKNSNNSTCCLSWLLVMGNCEAEFIYQNIFSWLDHKSVLNLSMINRYMRSICVQFHRVGFRMEWWNLAEYKRQQQHPLVREFPFERVVHVHLEGEPILEVMPKIHWENVKSLHLNVHYYKNVEECSKILNFAFEESSLLLREVVLNSRERSLSEMFTLTNVLDRVNVRGITLDRLSTNLPVNVNRMLQYEMSVNKFIVGEHFNAGNTMLANPSSLHRVPCEISNNVNRPATNTPHRHNNAPSLCNIKVFRCKVTEKNLREFCSLISMSQFQTQILEISLTPSLIVPDILSMLIDLFAAHLKQVKKIALASSLDPLLLKKVFSSFRSTPDNFELVLVKKQQKK